MIFNEDCMRLIGDSRSHIWLRHYASSVQVAHSIPDEIIGFLNLPNHSSNTMALGSNQSVTEMKTRNFARSKGWPALKAYTLVPSESR
jgi:hypothetical protein